VLSASGTPIAIGPVLPRARGAFGERGKQAAASEPLVAPVASRTTPSLDVFAGLAELHDGRTGHVSVLGRVPFFERMRPVEDPDITVRVGGRAADAAKQ